MKKLTQIVSLILAVGIVAGCTACSGDNGIRQQDRVTKDGGSSKSSQKTSSAVTTTPNASLRTTPGTEKKSAYPSFTVPLDVVPADPSTDVTEPQQDDNTPATSKNGKVFTIVGYSNTDIPGLLNAWLGNAIAPTYEENRDILSENNFAPTGVQVEYYNTGVADYDYLDVIIQRRNSGGDMDCFIVDQPQLLNIVTSHKDMVWPLSAFGFAEGNFENEYKWVGNIGRDFDGTRYGVSWQASPGIFVYSGAIASNYLGVKTPQQMQALISDFNKFTATAKTLKEKTAGIYGTNGEGMAIADSITGLYYAYQYSSLNYRWNTTMTSELTPDTLNYRPLTAFLSYSKMFFENGYLPNNGYSAPVGDAWSEDWWRFARQERVFGYFTGSWGIDESILGTLASDPGGLYPIEEGRNVDSRGMWRVCQGPQAHVRGGYWLMINYDIDNPYEAKDFIYSSIINPNSMYVYSIQTGEFPNSKAVAEQIMNDSGDNTSKFDLLSKEFLGGQDYFSVFADICENLEIPQDENIGDKSYKFRSKYDQDLDVAAIATAVRNAHPTALMTAPTYTDDQNLYYFEDYLADHSDFYG
jgi:hypothetical protein